MTDRLVLRLFEPVQAASGCGVYVIRCISNDSFYIGSSRNIKRRLAKHFAMLRGGRHENPKLQNSFEKYGENAFTCALLECASEAEIYAVEQKWIDKYWGSKCLMNIQRIAGRPPTFNELPQATRERKREKHKTPTGRPASAKILAELAQRVGANNPNFGKKLPVEHVAKMRAALFASPKLWRSGEQSPIFGLKRSPETLLAMSEAQRQRFQRGEVNAKSKPCQRVDQNGNVTVFQSARAASAALGLGPSTVGRWCSGARAPQDGCNWGYVHAD